MANACCCGGCPRTCDELRAIGQPVCEIIAEFFPCGGPVIITQGGTWVTQIAMIEPPPPGGGFAPTRFFSSQGDDHRLRCTWLTAFNQEFPTIQNPGCPSPLNLCEQAVGYPRSYVAASGRVAIEFSKLTNDVDWRLVVTQDVIREFRIIQGSSMCVACPPWHTTATVPVMRFLTIPCADLRRGVIYQDTIVVPFDCNRPGGQAYHGTITTRVWFQ